MAKTVIARVLIVDEYPLFCMGLSSLLKLTPGYSVVGEVATIADALEIAEKEKPHLVIMVRYYRDCLKIQFKYKNH